jgi:16S rRNA (cytosine1402-N4)-methyltransferase
MSQVFKHEPVMEAEVVALFAPVPPGVVIDATVGAGGHASAILEAHPHLRVLGIDRDPEAVEAATDKLSKFGDRATVRHAPFSRLAQEMEDVNASVDQVTGVLFDLGVSSPQLDRAERGFSYRHDGPVDMRMDPTTGPSGAEIVNTWSVDDLSRLFAANGEGRFAMRIARAVVAARPITTTAELAEVVRTAIPAATRRTGGHPARRVFQAVRIAVNDELDQLAEAIPTAIDILAPRGRCVAISYHSGEDRIVKAAFSRAETGGCVCPPGLPCACGAVPVGRLLFRGSRRPSSDEMARNRRAESARLRAVERLEPVDGASSLTPSAEHGWDQN